MACVIGRAHWWILKHIALDGEKKKGKTRIDMFIKSKIHAYKRICILREFTQEKSDINPTASLGLSSSTLLVCLHFPCQQYWISCSSTNSAVSLSLPLYMLLLRPTLPSGSLRDGHTEPYSLLNHQNLQLAIWCCVAAQYILLTWTQLRHPQ